MDPIMILMLPLLFLSSQSYASSESLPAELCSSEASSLYSIRAHLAYNYHDLEEEVEEEESSLFLSLSRSLFREISVDDFGAEGDGSTDDTLAFQKAWRAVCSSSIPHITLMVPKGKSYLLKPITFSGPCKSNVSVVIKGTVEASSDPSDWNYKNQRIWILFSNVNDLSVGGGGTINGNGMVWWQKSCKVDKSRPCKDAPTALTFRSCSSINVHNMHVKDSQQIHVKFAKCKNVVASGLNITAPADSPNTDGIHITKTENVQVTNSTIRTGDDCISIVSGSHGIQASNIVCGPGHGISIGSLGAKKSAAQVSEVTVDTVKMNGTTNGVRIKTYQGGSGYARNITFENINMFNVKNPIIIDQNYCDSKNPCKPQKSAVQISSVQYKNIKGTSSSRFAINFNCSKSTPCSEIFLQDVNLVEEDGDDAESFCENVNQLTTQGLVNPKPCI